ncbi:hypothetical protein RND59_00140 [Vibrio ruber]|uniref:hypothetical protein n=1 Tax=Vibrio ruber TaxID=184755 RepID=UPI0028936627|nr:hypothetical protein [Vibrio ruber]WNJ95568.1 hypothetical protein RND59_00140 [Vibrio ruber]
MAKKGQYTGVRKLFARYWVAYGGFKSIVGSPYMHASLFITLISSGIWLEYDWVKIPISVLPNIIGFSLGGYAIWLALGDDKFRASISGKTKDGGESPFIVVNATFVHFIVLQILALIAALIGKSQPIYNSPLFIQRFLLDLAPWLYDVSQVISIACSFIGYFLFIYAIFSALAATMAIFRIAGWLEVYHIKKARSNSVKSTDNKQINKD